MFYFYMSREFTSAQVVVEVVVTNYVFFCIFTHFLVGENVGLGPVLKVATTNEHKK